jgi:putative DNA primase/helicase
VANNKKTDDSREWGESPVDLADDYLNGRGYMTPQGLWLRKHRGQWLRFDGVIFRPLTQEELEADINQYFRETRHRTKLKRSFVNEVVQQLTCVCLIPNRIELPARDQGEWTTEAGIVVLENGVINLGSLKHGAAVELMPHSPALVSRVYVPYVYDPTADCPRWQRFLEDILPDPGMRLLLQQIFGYCLTFDVTQQKFFMFEGSGGNGKGVVTNVLTHLLGAENISALSLNRFGGPHELVVTLGKLVNITSELKASDKVAEHVLKQLTGGDAISFNPKYKEPFSAKPTAKIILVTNERPQFTDRSNGLWRRLIILPFPVTIPEDRRNVHVEDELTAELPGILNWAIAGAYSLYQAGRFLEPALSVEARESFKRESNPAAMFLSDHCAAQTDQQVSSRDLYGAYKEYCDHNGYKPLNEQNFSKEVLRVFPRVTKTRVRLPDGRRSFYTGLSISPLQGADPILPDQAWQAPQGAKRAA